MGGGISLQPLFKQTDLIWVLFPLIFYLLYFSQAERDVLFISELLRHRKEYPINLNHRLVPKTEYQNRSRPVISLTPLLFATARWQIFENFMGGALRQMAPFVYPQRFQKADDVDSKVIEQFINYYLDSILDGSVDIIHHPMTTVIKC